MIQIAHAPGMTTSTPPKPAAPSVDVAALNQQIARGVVALCDAIDHLGKVRDGMPNNPRIRKVMQHLIAAAAEVPDESWGVMFLVNHIGYDEIVSRFHATVSKAVEP